MKRRFWDRVWLAVVAVLLGGSLTLSANAQGPIRLSDQPTPPATPDAPALPGETAVPEAVPAPLLAPSCAPPVTAASCYGAGSCVSCPGSCCRPPRPRCRDPYFPTPFGCATRAHLMRQVHLAQAARQTLYHYDFMPAGSPADTRLSPRGWHELRRIAARTAFHPGPVVVQTTGREDLDKARRRTVVDGLNRLGVVTEVATGRPWPGLPGVEAVREHQGMLEQTSLTASDGTTTGGN